jgi:ribosomal-protein-alanine N-acetyltransferase
MDLPAIDTARLRLRHVEPTMALAHGEFMRRNRAHFAPWEPPRPADIESAEGWVAPLLTALDDFAADKVVRWAVFEPDSGRMIGRVNFTGIVRGPFQSCTLGYQIDAQHEGRGLMREALEAAIGYMFDVKRLHRIEANYRPENLRSGALLMRLGFEQTGLAPRYLFIDGAWRDHVQTQRLNDGFRFERPAAG